VNAESATWRISTTLASLPPVARPLLDELENIAKEIHDRYVTDQTERTKSDAPELRPWDDLPEDIKYSNLSQARHMVDKLRLIGCGIAPKNSAYSPITSFTKGEIEYLSIIEHDRWMAERLSSGWQFGDEKNTAEKISPYLIPWGSLSEDVRELDRNTVRNIPSLLDSVGLVAYRIET